MAASPIGTLLYVTFRGRGGGAATGGRLLPSMLFGILLVNYNNTQLHAPLLSSRVAENSSASPLTRDTFRLLLRERFLLLKDTARDTFTSRGAL